MTVLVTGGAGFLGTRLIQSLLAGASGPAPTRVICVDQVASAVDGPARRVGDRRVSPTLAFVRAAVPPDVTTIWHLAAVLSGQSEAEPDLAMAVNVGGTQALLDACRTAARPPRFVFSSTIAVFGGPLPDGGARGSRAASGVHLRHDESHRGTARPRGHPARPRRRHRVPSAHRVGAPGPTELGDVQLRERHRPRASRRHSRASVRCRSIRACGSPRRRSRHENLAHAGRLPAAMLQDVRTINLPGICVTPAQLLDSLERAAGAAVRSSRAARTGCTHRRRWSKAGLAPSTRRAHCGSGSRPTATRMRSSRSSSPTARDVATLGVESGVGATVCSRRACSTVRRQRVSRP